MSEKNEIRTVESEIDILTKELMKAQEELDVLKNDFTIATNKMRALPPEEIKNPHSPTIMSSLKEQRDLIQRMNDVMARIHKLTAEITNLMEIKDKVFSTEKVN